MLNQGVTVFDSRKFGLEQEEAARSGLDSTTAITDKPDA